MADCIGAVQECSSSVERPERACQAPLEQSTDALGEVWGLRDFDGAERDAGEILHREYALHAPRCPGKVECHQEEAWCSKAEDCIATIGSFSSGIR